MKLAVLGAGAWGTAISISFAARHGVTLWGRDAGLVSQLAAISATFRDSRCRRQFA